MTTHLCPCETTTEMRVQDTEIYCYQLFFRLVFFLVDFPFFAGVFMGFLTFSILSVEVFAALEELWHFDHNTFMALSTRLSILISRAIVNKLFLTLWFCVKEPSWYWYTCRADFGVSVIRVNAQDCTTVTCSHSICCVLLLSAGEKRLQYKLGLSFECVVSRLRAAKNAGYWIAVQFSRGSSSSLDPLLNRTAIQYPAFFAALKRDTTHSKPNPNLSCNLFSPADTITTRNKWNVNK